MSQGVGLKYCSKKECKSCFKPHRWGTIQANKDGWFIQRNGKAWCPEHIPDWVDNWRRRGQ